MKKWTKSSESFVKKQGWKLVKGYKVNIEDENMEDFDIFYFAKKDLKDFVIECEFWQHDEIETIYEDIDMLIEFQYEEYFDDEDNLWDEPVQDLQLSQVTSKKGD